MVWFKAVSINAWQRVIGFGISGTETINFSDYDLSSKICIQLDPGGLQTISVSSVSLNDWVHLTTTFTTTWSAIYFNGILDATVSGMI